MREDQRSLGWCANDTARSIWMDSRDVQPVDDSDLPELTAEERAALNSIPDDAVSHWWRGEKWDFKRKIWIV